LSFFGIFSIIIAVFKENIALNSSIKKVKTAIWLLIAVFFVSFAQVEAADSTITVSTLQELQNALDDDNISVVKVKNTITLTDGTYLSASSLANGDSKTVQIIEPFMPDTGNVVVENDTLKSPVIVEGENDYALFNIQRGSSVVISNLTLMGGFTSSLNADYVGSAGGIDNYGNLQMYYVNIKRTGTALLNRPNATSVLVDCNIVRNANWFGGGILNLADENENNGGTVIMDRCSFTENQSLGSSHGGGAAENQGLMCLNNCVVANNSSTEIGGGINNCKGGTLYVMNSTLTGNITTSQSYGTTAGGAIGNAGGAGNVYIVNSILADNGFDTGEHVNSSCLGRYNGATYSHQCAVVNTVIGSVAGMDRLNAANTSSKTDGLFNSYRDDGVVAAGGLHDGYSSGFSHSYVISDGKEDLNALYPAMAPQTEDHFLFQMAVPTYFDYSMIIDGTGRVPAMAFETNGVRTVLGPNVSDTTKRVEVTFNGTSRLENNAMGASVVPLAQANIDPPPGSFWVKLLPFTGGKVSGVTIYGDSYISNSLITVHAEAASAYYLDGWILNGEKVKGTEQQYVFSFHLTQDTEIKPIFAPVVTRIFGARQRYPWNNLVDIDYMVSEEDAVRYRLVFTATFEEDGTNRTVQLKSFVKNADGRTPQRLGEKPDLRKDGPHRVTWDSAADGIELKNKEIRLRLMACEGDER
jgi:hypothetical protein